MSYYVRIRGKAFGPFEENQLVDMKSKGKIGRTSEISSDRVDWKPAGEFDFLFTPTAAPAQAEQLSTSYSIVPAEWFYSFNGTEGFGPIQEMEMVQMIRSGTLLADSYGWKQGQTALPLRSIREFGGFFAAAGGSAGPSGNTEAMSYSSGAPAAGRPKGGRPSPDEDYWDIYHKIKITRNVLVITIITWLVSALLGGISFAFVIIVGPDTSSLPYLLTGWFFATIFFLANCTFWPYLCLFVKHCWRAVPLSLRGGITPNQGGWFLIIPLFNLFWLFPGIYGLSRKINAGCLAHGLEMQASASLVLGTCILVLLDIVGILILILPFFVAYFMVIATVVNLAGASQALVRKRAELEGIEID